MKNLKLPLVILLVVLIFMFGCQNDESFIENVSANSFDTEEDEYYVSKTELKDQRSQKKLPYTIVEKSYSFEVEPTSIYVIYPQLIASEPNRDYAGVDRLIERKAAFDQLEDYVTSMEPYYSKYFITSNSENFISVVLLTGVVTWPQSGGNVHQHTTSINFYMVDNMLGGKEVKLNDVLYIDRRFYEIYKTYEKEQIAPHFIQVWDEAGIFMRLEDFQKEEFVQFYVTPSGIGMSESLGYGCQHVEVEIPFAALEGLVKDKEVWEVMKAG